MSLGLLPETAEAEVPGLSSPNVPDVHHLPCEPRVIDYARAYVVDSTPIKCAISPLGGVSNPGGLSPELNAPEMALPVPDELTRTTHVPDDLVGGFAIAPENSSRIDDTVPMGSMPDSLANGTSTMLPDREILAAAAPDGGVGAVSTLELLSSLRNEIAWQKLCGATTFQGEIETPYGPVVCPASLVRPQMSP